MEQTTLIQEIKNLKKVVERQNSLLQSFLRGMMIGLGSTIGVVIVFSLIGWILQVIGIIPAIANQAGELRNLLESLKK